MWEWGGDRVGLKAGCGSFQRERCLLVTEQDHRCCDNPRMGVGYTGQGGRLEKDRREISGGQLTEQLNFHNKDRKSYLCAVGSAVIWNGSTTHCPRFSGIPALQCGLLLEVFGIEGKGQVLAWGRKGSEDQSQGRNVDVELETRARSTAPKSPYILPLSPHVSGYCTIELCHQFTTPTSKWLP